MEDKQKIFEELSEECVCPLCLDLYDNPRLLPTCGHAFCDRCLRDFARTKNTKQVECPLCRKLFDNNVDNLKIHLQLKNICDKLRLLQNNPLNNSNSSSQTEEMMNRTNPFANSPPENINQGEMSPPPFNPEFIQSSQQPQLQPIDPHQPFLQQNLQQQIPPYYYNPQPQPQSPPNYQIPQTYQYHGSPINQPNQPNQSGYVEIAPSQQQQNEIPSDQPGYVIQSEDEISQLKKQNQNRQVKENSGGFWSNFSSLFAEKELNIREGCGINQCVMMDFKISQEQVPSLVEKWFESLWFKPVGFTQAAVVQSQTCIQGFFPFELYEVTTTTTYNATISYKTAKKQTDKTMFKSGAVRKTHKLIIFNSSQHDHIKRWVDQQSIFLSGEATVQPLPVNNMHFQTVCYPSRSSEQSWDEATRILSNRVEADCRSDAQCSFPRATYVSLTHTHTDYINIRKNKVYFPLYLIEYKYKDELYTVIVNGVTGQVTGNRSYGTGVVGEMVSKGWNFVSNLFFGSGDKNNK